MSGALAQRYHIWDNRAEQRLEKTGWKWIRTVGPPVRRTGTTASIYIYIYNIVYIYIPGWAGFPAGLRWSFFPLSSRFSLSSFFIKIFILHSPRVLSKYIYSWGTRPSDGLPHLSYSLSTRFLKPLFSHVPAVVPLCKCATHSLPFQCLRSLLPLGSVGKMDNFLVFWAPVDLPEEIIIDFGYLS